MEVRTITDPAELPHDASELKKRHFQEVFGEYWEQVYARSPHINHDEEVLVADIDGKPAGWVFFRRQTYDIKFRGFTVHPEFRGQGVAKALLQELTSISRAHHIHATSCGEKQSDIGLMFLKSMVYFDSDREGEAFAFGRFLTKMGFTARPYNALVLDDEEKAGMDAYQRLYPELKGRLKIFRLPTVNTGIVLKDEAKVELLKLSPEELAVVMKGLEAKLGNFERSGRVSYRYDLCPICAFMGSSEQNSDNCKRCCIYLTCMEPFREQGRFKEDYEVSAAYFTAMRDFLLQHKTPR